MAVQTLRPDGTTANTGALTGGATAYEVLSDDSDSTYITFETGESATVTVDDATLPAGSALLSVVERVRANRTGGLFASQMRTQLNHPALPLHIRTVTVNWASPATIEMAPRDQAIDADDLDDLELTVTAVSGVSDLRVYEAYVDVYYVEQPAVTVDAPTGTVTDANAPLFSWTPSLDTDGGDQAAFELRVFDDATYGDGGFDPDTSTPVLDRAGGSETEYRDPSAVLPDDTYRAYVRIAQTVNGALLWSDWEFTEFEVDVTKPDPPNLTAVTNSDNGRVRLNISGPFSGISIEGAQLQYSVDGVTWEWARTQWGDDENMVIPITESSGLAVYDNEAPNGFGLNLFYRARSMHDYSGFFAYSDWDQTDGYWQSTDCWLKNPLKPSQNVRLRLEMYSYPDVNQEARQGIQQPLGATVPIVVEDTPAAENGTIVVQLHDADQLAALNALLDERCTVLLQVPQGTGDAGEPDRYVRFKGRATVRAIDKSWTHTKRVTLPWVRVDKPAGSTDGSEYTVED